MTVAHHTLSFDRSLAHPPAKVFAAFADPVARAVWTPPSPDLNMAFRESDFRPGGRDLCVCGPGMAEGVTVETLYHEIVPDQRIVSTEVIGLPDAPEGVSLVTTTLTPTGAGTDLAITVQLVGLGEGDVMGEVEGGWTAALHNLAQYLG